MPKKTDNFSNLSPFEFKEFLIKLARSNKKNSILDAGRGNPNWLLLEPREAFLQLGQFALLESRHQKISAILGGQPKKKIVASALLIL